MSVLFASVACGSSGGGTSAQPGAGSGGGAGVFVVRGTYLVTNLSAKSKADCADKRNVDIFAQKGGVNVEGAMLATSPLTSQNYEESSENCVFGWTVTIPVSDGRYGICVELPNARGIIPCGLWMSRSEIENFVKQYNGTFQLSQG
jgi:hypothetical protein